MHLMAIALAAFGIGALAAPEATPLRSSSGLHGVVMRGPTKPVCTNEEPCEEPAAGLVLRFSRAGSVVGRTTTDRAGAYRLALRPGTYAVTATRRVIGSG